MNNNKREVFEWDIKTVPHVFAVRDGDIIVSPAPGGYAVYRWRTGRTPAALGFTKSHEEAMEMAKGRVAP